MQYYERNDDKLAAEREKDKADDNGSRSDFYSLKKGRTVIRVLPSWSEEGLWFREMREYYFRMGDNHLFVTSPLDFGQPDPLDDYGRSVYEKGNEEAVKEAKRFRAKYRYLLNAIVLSDTQDTDMHAGIKIVKVPKTVKMALVDFDTDPEYGDISNPEKGFNMIIDRSGEGLDTEYSVKAQRERTNIFELLKSSGLDPAQLTLHNLDEVHLQGLKTEEELRGMLEQLKGSYAAKAPASSFNQPAATEVPASVTTGPPVTEAPKPAGGPVMTAVGAVEVPEVPAAPKGDE